MALGDLGAPCMHVHGGGLAAVPHSLPSCSCLLPTPPPKHVLAPMLPAAVRPPPPVTLSHRSSKARHTTRVATPLSCSTGIT